MVRGWGSMRILGLLIRKRGCGNVVSPIGVETLTQRTWGVKATLPQRRRGFYLTTISSKICALSTPNRNFLISIKTGTPQLKRGGSPIDFSLKTKCFSKHFILSFGIVFLRAVKSHRQTNTIVCDGVPLPPLPYCRLSFLAPRLQLQ